MLGLDPRSIILLAGMLAALMSFVLMSLRRNYPRSIHGLGEWATGPLLCFTATLLLAGRGRIPDFLSTVVANLVLLAGGVLFLLGSQRFYGLPSTWKAWAVVVVASGFVFTWFLVVEPAYAVRVVLFTTLMASVFVSHAWLLLRHGGRTFPVRFTAAVCVLQSIVLGLRLVTTALHPTGGSVFDPTPMQTTYIATYAVSILLVTIGVILMATDRLRAEFEHMATHDALTGVLNRRAVLEVCAAELERSHRYGRPMVLLMLDLDHFKAINDGHGHQAGDRVLTAFTRRCVALLRKPDHLGRYGGEEFVIALPETTQDEARVVAQRIVDAHPADAPAPACTVSIGLAASRAGENLDALLARADAALYQAKQQGRNRIETG